MGLKRMKKLVVSLVAIVFCSCNVGSTFVLVNTRNYSVKYEVTGTASRVDVTTNDSVGNVELYENMSLPWSKTFVVTVEEKDYFFAKLIAKSHDVTSSVTVAIYVDGELFESSVSFGAYAVAETYGRVEYELNN